jgi:hypothetical protein
MLSVQALLAIDVPDIGGWLEAKHARYFVKLGGSSTDSKPGWFKTGQLLAVLLLDAQDDQTAK